MVMFLDDISMAVRRELERDKTAPAKNTKNTFFNAVKSPGLSFICEVKKASPSKGVICEDYRPAEFARDYEAAGAAAVSVLTEKTYFKGGIDDLKSVRSASSLPILRKDFIVDAFQIYEARIAGADAVLLIAALLDRAALSSFIKLAGELALDALVETHNKEEVDSALGAGAKIIGINNRDLKTFKVDIETSFKLKDYIFNSLKIDIPLVAESGIQNALDVQRLDEAGFDAVLIGETIMRSHDKKSVIKELKSKLRV